MDNKRKLAIIGGGASGVFSAINLAKDTNLDITIFEKQNRILKKVLQTGNGMCNLTNTNINNIDNLDYFYNTNKIYNTINIFNQTKCEEVFKNFGIIFRKDLEGRCYPYSRKASNVCDVLINCLEKSRANIYTDTAIEDIEYLNNQYKLKAKGKEYNFDYVIISTGGKSGITFENNYNVYKKLNLNITELKPSLVGFKLQENTKSISGIRLKCDAKLIDKINNKVYIEKDGEVTFKDNGISGIIILDLSRHFKNKAILELDLLSEYDLLSAKNMILELYKVSNNIEEALLGIVPKMIAKDIIIKANNDIERIAYILKHYSFNVEGTYNFDMSQVTRGGVSLDCINLDTYESYKFKNLYIIGEALDVDGKCGGFNLHFAWASAYMASLAIKEKENK